MVLSVLCALAFLGLFLGLSLYSRRRSDALLGESSTANGVGADRESFADYYRPMTRILDPRDLDQTRTLSGISASDFARFRARRIQAFRAYLNDMRLDFNRIEFKLRYLMLAASEDQAEIVVALNRVKSSFQWQLLRVEFQLFLFRFGYSSVDVAPLVEMLEQLESSLIRRPASSAASA
jgi:hypothetical protein